MSKADQNGVDCEKFLEFCRVHGSDAATELLETICDAHYSGNGEDVTFTDIYQHDACNHTLSGSVTFRGVEYRFIIDNGNWNGTQVRQFGGVDDVGVYKHPAPTRWTMVPIKTLNAVQQRIYELWTREPWFEEMCGKYAYDRHFQPGGAVENYWREKAATKGLRFEIICEVEEAT